MSPKDLIIGYEPRHKDPCQTVYCGNVALTGIGYCWEHLSKMGAEATNKYINELFSKCSSQGHNTLFGWWLKGVDFRGRSFKNIVFSNCNLNQSRFDNCKTENVTFKQCNLMEAMFVKGNFSGSRFLLSFINKADFAGANLTGSELDRCMMDAVQMSYADLTYGRIEHCELKRSRFFSVNLDSAFVNSSNLEQSYLDSSHGNNVNFNGADLREASLIGVTLEGASFIGADLSRATMKKSGFMHADFRNATLMHADMQSSDLTKSDFRNATLMHADMQSSDLTKAEFNNSSLSFAYVKDAIVTDVDLDAAGLVNVDVYTDKTGRKVVGRKQPLKGDTHVFTWLCCYTKYLGANRLEATGVLRNYEYIIALLVGGIVSICTTLFSQRYFVMGFWSGFLIFLLLYKLFLPRELYMRRRYILSIAKKIRSSILDG